MKTSIFCLFFSLFATFLIAQPVISNAYFVAADDVLMTRVDDNPDASIQVLGTGQQTWDFSSLSFQGETTIDSFFDASVGVNNADFPDAELVQIVNGVEFYINVTPTVQEIIGYAGMAPGGIGIETSANYTQPSVFRTAPLKAFGTYDFNSLVSLAVAVTDLPEDIQNQIAALQADSIRVEISNSVLEFGDAYGQMKIPGGTYDVLRIKTTEFRNTDVYARTVGTWINVTSVVQNALPDVPGLGPDTVKHFVFYSEGVLEAIADVYVDNEDEMKVESVNYKANPVALSDLEDNRPSLTAYPNPVEEEVMFQVDNVSAGDYQIRIYNILGSVVWKKNYYVNGSSNLYWENLGGLVKGTYLMSLVDKQNYTISTQRLVVIKP